MEFSEKVWEIIKPLATEIDIYEETTDEDPLTLPGNYIVYQTDVTNTARVRADGKATVRASNCEIAVFTAGNANTVGNKYFVNAVENLLIQNGVEYIKINVGYLSDLGKSQVTFDFCLN